MKFLLPKISLLGLVLMGVSAITAAVIPNKHLAKFDQGGSLTREGTADPAAGVEWSCTITNGEKAVCNITASTATTVDPETDSYTNLEVSPRQTTLNTTTIPV